MKVIDIDSHADPRPEDYVVEPEYALLKPQVYVDARGSQRVIFDNKIMLKLSGGEMAIGGEHGKLSWRAANYDADLRYEQVVAAGIDYQFVFPGRGLAKFSYIDAKAGAAFCRAYNDWVCDRFAKPYPKTFTGLAQLPLQDIPLATKELERCVKDLRMNAFVMPTNWNGIDIADPYWWNFWDSVRELGITGIIVHIDSLPAYSSWVGKERLAVLGAEGATAKRILSQPFEYSTNIINLIFGGMMDSFPELRFAFLEAGAEFAIVLKHRIEENLEQIGYLREMLAHPLEWYFDRLYFLIDDRMLEDNGRLLHYALEELGEDNLFLGSDYPHLDGQLHTFTKIKDRGDLTPSAKEKILSKNMETLVGKELPNS